MDALKELIDTPMMQHDLLPSLRCTYAAMPVYRVILILVSVTWWKCYQMFIVNCCKISAKRTSFRIVSVTHAALATSQALYIFIFHHSILVWNNPPPNYCEPVPLTEYTFCVSIGYFIYDLYKNITTEFSWDFVGHGSMSLLIFLIVTISGVGTRPALAVLLYEMSTIFLHFYAFLFYAGYTTLGAFFRLVFAFLFLMVRVILGTFVTFEMIDTILLRIRDIKVDCLPFFWQMVCLVINIMFHCLNLYWLSLIIGKALQFRKEKKSVMHHDKGKKEDFDDYRDKQWEEFKKGKKSNKKKRLKKKD